MPTKKKPVNAASKPVQISGYRRKPRYGTFVFDLNEDGEDFTPLEVTIRVNLTFGELDDIPNTPTTTFREIFDVIAPYVIAWNVERENLEAGEMVPVPPPAEGGPDMFKVLDHLEIAWLILKVRTGHLGGEDQKKDSTPSEPTPEPSGSNTTDTKA